MRSYQKLFALLFFVGALAFVATAQDDDFGGAFQDPADGGAQFDASQLGGDNPQLQQEMIEMQRTKLWGCYFLTKNKLYSMNKEISQVAVGKTGDALLKRMTVDIMQRCMSNIQPEEAQRVLDTFVKADFRIEDWDQIHNFNLQEYQGEEVRTELGAEEKMVYEYYTKIDENVRNQWEEQAEKEDVERRRKVDYEPKIGGLSLKETSFGTKFLYTLIVLGLIAVVFLFAYRRLFAAGEETPYEKAKRERREKSEKKKVKTN